MSASIQSMGGKARAASMTPEQRSEAGRHAAKKAARTLGKEGRSARAAKGWATRKKIALGDARNGVIRVGDPVDPYIYDAATGQQIGTIKPIKRPMRQRVLEVLGSSPGPWTSNQIADSLVPAAPLAEVRNALSSLRTGGHVVSEGTGKAKLWRRA